MGAWVVAGALAGCAGAVTSDIVEGRGANFGRGKLTAAAVGAGVGWLCFMFKR